MRPSTVCVSGVSGFIGSQIAHDLLSKGYSVHGTVRKNVPDKTQHLTSHPQASNLKIFEADLLKPETFASALKECEAAIHVASPYKMEVKDPQKELVDPALIGTKGFLESCKAAKGVTKVVLTSSVAAVSDEGRKDGKKFTEDDWNEHSTLKRLPYYYSKTVAEQAAWKWADENKESGIKLVVINPFLVAGSSLVKSLNESAAFMKDIATGGLPGIMDLTFTYVDVKDVSLAHILAMESDIAEGRYICASQPALSMKETVQVMTEEGFHPNTMDFTNSFMTNLVKTMSHVMPGGQAGHFVRNNLGRPLLVSNDKIRRDLKMDFRSPKDVLKDTLFDLQKWGHVAEKQN